MFRLFRRRGTAIHTMDLVLLISAVGTAFAIARGPITKHLGGWIIGQTVSILDWSEGDYTPAKDPNEDIQRVSDASDVDNQVAGFTSQTTFFNSRGSGDSVALAGDLEEVLNPAIDAADLQGQYRDSSKHVPVQTANNLQSEDYVINPDDFDENIPAEE